MEINPASITQYCATHSSSPGDLCAELEAFTLKNVPMSVMLSGPVVGSFLGFMVSALGAKRCLEIGTYTGYSALCMAQRLPPDGRLITLDINTETTNIARRFWDRSESGKRIELILGSAKETLKQVASPVDLVFIDADKAGYAEYLKQTLELLSRAGVIIADNALYDGEVLNPVKASPDGKAMADFNRTIKSRTDLESVLLPIRDGLWLIRKR